MAQKTGGRNWRMLLGIGALVLAVLISISGFLGQGPAHLRGDLKSDVQINKITVFYGAVLFYNHAGMPLIGVILTGIILLVVLILIAFWFYELSTKKTTSLASTTAAIALSVLALTIAVFGFLPNLIVTYKHLTSAEFDGYRYNLGLSGGIASINFYVIGKCDRFGILCDCYAVSPVESLNYLDYDPTSSIPPTLQREAKTKIIYIKTLHRTIPISKIE